MIFFSNDSDGLLPLHYIAWRSALAEWNCDLPEDRFYAWDGFPVAGGFSDCGSTVGSKSRVKVEGAGCEISCNPAQVPMILAIQR
jgi:hypothetical protein